MTDYIYRYIEKSVTQDLKRKMVFIGGPRQSGKTTLAKQLCRAEGLDPGKRYLNWDALKDRESIMREQFPSGQGLLILDEVHKYSRWRQTVKGLYDKRGNELNILVTGSARLDYYRRGGDSLQGRYHFYRLFPLSLKETGDCSVKTVNDLLIYGGFPEPFLSQSEKEARRWSREYRTRIIHEDLIDLENVRDLGLVERMALRLPELVGSPLSINSLREDLNVSHQAVSRWVQILENLYMIFRIYPFGAPKIRAVKKEAKHYHLDWTVIDDPGARFENLMACHLLKWVCFLQDTEGRDVDLRFFRDIDRREVDFVVMEKGKPTQFIECKRSVDKQPSRALKYLKVRFPNVSAVQVSLADGPDVITKENIRMCSAHIFLSELV
ncbi:MAG: ATP-binding protein [Desulfobacteraceae bacterium]|nr:ATP-binding protein [Desulfobacteraceae bacterium]